MADHKAPDCTFVECDDGNPVQINPEVVAVTIDGIRFDVPLSNVVAIEYIREADNPRDESTLDMRRKLFVSSFFGSSRNES